MEQMKMNLKEGGQNKAIIVDVDGTIADHYDEEGVQMREHHDYGQVINDRPIWSIINLVKILHAEGFDILITTGRMDRPGVRRDTEAWLGDRGRYLRADHQDPRAPLPPRVR